jgi:hypothetical protein
LQEAKVAEEDHDMMAGIKTEAVSSILLDRHFMTGACAPMVMYGIYH